MMFSNVSILARSPIASLFFQVIPHLILVSPLMIYHEFHCNSFTPSNDRKSRPNNALCSQRPDGLSPFYLGMLILIF